MSAATINMLLTAARVRKLPLTTAEKIGVWDLDRWYRLAAFETNSKIDTQANWDLCVAYLRATAKEAHGR